MMRKLQYIAIQGIIVFQNLLFRNLIRIAHEEIIQSIQLQIQHLAAAVLICLLQFIEIEKLEVSACGETMMAGYDISGMIGIRDQFLIAIMILIRMRDE